MPSATNPWIYAGRGDSFPDLSTNKSNQDDHSSQPSADLSDAPVASEATLHCRILQLASSSTSAAQMLDAASAQATLSTHPQVLVFRYRDKFHAIDHACPHNAFPLSKGSLYDIEDFGIILSAGITCPKHGWEFDLHTGRSDRGGYKLNVWEVEVRSGENGFGEIEEEVWVRRKENKRIG